jgi:hypothetical protein
MQPQSHNLDAVTLREQVFAMTPKQGSGEGKNGHLFRTSQNH